MMDYADRRPVSGGYKFDLCRIRRPAASWPSLLTVLLAWVTQRNRMLGGLNRKPLTSEHEAIKNDIDDLGRTLQ